MSVKRLHILIVLALCAGLSLPGPAWADDTCIFTVTADAVPPNVILLLDNGAEMEKIAWHGSYDTSLSYSKPTCGSDNVYVNPVGSYPLGDANGAFCNPDGYAVQGGELRKVNPDLSISTTGGVPFRADGYLAERHVLWFDWREINGVMQAGYYGWTGDIAARWTVGTQIKGETSGALAKVVEVFSYKNTTCGVGCVYKEFGVTVAVTSGTFVAGYNENIYNTTGTKAGGKPYGPWSRFYRRAVALPQTPSASVDAAGIKDNATLFRYDTNYLNWIFYANRYDQSGNPVAGSNYTGTGNDLPSKSRFYYAKKAILDTGKLTGNKAKFAVYNFTSTSVGASNVQPLGNVVATVAADPVNNVLDPNFINAVNNMGTVTYSPLAEGLADLGGVFAGKSISGEVATDYCQKNFNIVVTAGVSSQDQAPSSQGVPGTLKDYDEDDLDIGEGMVKVDANLYAVPVNLNGTTYLDDAAYYLYTNDIIGYRPGFQNLATYTVGVMTNKESRAFLINTSNNGNGNFNLYDTTDPEYGKFHFEASSPDGISSALLAALRTVLSRTSSFTAPVVPVTRTTSGDLIYLSFFKPSAENFWRGDITKFGLNQNNEIVDDNDNPATEANGAMKSDAVPYWSTKEWADAGKDNYMDNSSRKIYTYLGGSISLTEAGNAFTTGNASITAALLGNPAIGRDAFIDYIRGADVQDEDKDGNTTENRKIIHADALHGEPLIVSYGPNSRMVFFAANDGMLHAVDDSDGKEAWGFVPPEQLHRLRLLLEGYEHPYYLDSSPKAFIYDNDKDGNIESLDGDKVILICGNRKGGSSYFALDVTDPVNPELLWRLSAKDDHKAGTLKLATISGTFVNGEALVDSAGGAATVDGTLQGGAFLDYLDRTSLFSVGATVTGGTSGAKGTVVAVTHHAPPADVTNTAKVLPDLGETWSEPSFGKVRTADNDITGTDVMFIGGGYSSDLTSGRGVFAVDVSNGAVVKPFVSGMSYSVVSAVLPVDADNNGFVDKLYVGDLGGQVWRVGKFDVDMDDKPLVFPRVNENISDWTAEVLFSAGCDEGLLCGDGLDNDFDGIVDERRRFFYAPDVTLEFGYDLLFIGSGDRENACATSTNNRIYVIRDNHVDEGFTEADLVDMTDGQSVVDLAGGTHKGFFIRLDPGEKILAEGTVFYKVFYVTSFLPSTLDPCKPGGDALLYAVSYKTGKGGADLNNDGTMDMKITIGGGIGSKPVTVIREEGTTLLVSVGSTNPNASTANTGAGIVDLAPESPPFNFFFLWWREMF